MKSARSASRFRRQSILCLAVAVPLAVIVFVGHRMAARPGGPLDQPQVSRSLPANQEAPSPFEKTAVLGTAPDPVLSQPSRPSFDCTTASSSAERKICADPALGKLDADMAEIYEVALRASSDRKAFAAKHAQWTRDERDACADAVCLRRVYELRIFALRGNR